MRPSLKIIDFHSHILPCVDHGSDGIKTSKKQIALMNDAGVDTVVLTPHFYPHCHTVEEFCKTVSAAAEELASQCEKRPHFCLGAEVLYCEGIERMEGLETLCIKGTNILLLELPMSEWSKGLVYEVKRLATNYTVVLAHIDRYVEHHFDELSALLSSGVLAQINTSSLYHKTMRTWLAPFLEADQIYAIGSDLHGANKKTYREFSKASRRLEGLYNNISEHSAEILKNAERI